MRRRVFVLFLGAAGIVILGAPLVVASPSGRRLVAGIAVLVLGAVVLLILGDRTRAAFGITVPSELELALRKQPEPPGRLPELEKIEREVWLGSARAFDLHYRLRPILRDIAEARLASRGIRPVAAREALGEELWELVQPDREPPQRRHAPGIPVEDLARVVETLERV